ncbi:hypothetical protein [Oceaniradius stylonematis]|uniref:hypothetical protein n=1 Tax=Oceaniradius stylonematis TaxID=2184161 RepID=UPI00273E2861|nr:hypothetical protein [Oceaniradius stylonematis]
MKRFLAAVALSAAMMAPAWAGDGDKTCQAVSEVRAIAESHEVTLREIPGVLVDPWLRRASSSDPSIAGHIGQPSALIMWGKRPFYAVAVIIYHNGMACGLITAHGQAAVELVALTGAPT